jgi:hypothetical protein
MSQLGRVKLKEVAFCYHSAKERPCVGAASHVCFDDTSHLSLHIHDLHLFFFAQLPHHLLNTLCLDCILNSPNCFALLAIRILNPNSVWNEVPSIANI